VISIGFRPGGPDEHRDGTYLIGVELMPLFLEQPRCGVSAQLAEHTVTSLGQCDYCRVNVRRIFVLPLPIGRRPLKSDRRWVSECMVMSMSPRAASNAEQSLQWSKKKYKENNTRPQNKSGSVLFCVSDSRVCYPSGKSLLCALVLTSHVFMLAW